MFNLEKRKILKHNEQWSIALEKTKQYINQFIRKGNRVLWKLLLKDIGEFHKFYFASKFLGSSSFTVKGSKINLSNTLNIQKKLHYQILRIMPDYLYLIPIFSFNTKTSNQNKPTKQFHHVIKCDKYESSDRCRNFDRGFSYNLIYKKHQNVFLGQAGSRLNIRQAHKL
ncbi:hypothetical protein RhiirA4_423256 [Rhizophagus irregularis]|uniref:Uncharacterized protein n=1 Tax=Rhizophagus irregularis TaxID=588596 RepID=A0A2I1GT70_9GLOM|nr:hypothetical protein RhiirA4_423256 [Rhizophagus irregularis]